MYSFLCLCRKLNIWSKRALLNHNIFLLNSFSFNIRVFFHMLDYEQIFNFDTVIFDLNVDFFIFKIIINT